MGVTLDDAIRLARELLERCPNTKKGVSRLNYCREIIVHGAHVVEESRCSVSLRKAVEVSLKEREGRRRRTLCELQYVCRRLLREAEDIAGKQLRNITPQHCHNMLSSAFSTPHQFCKARIVLHSVFACGIRHGWCNCNPVDAVPKPRLLEVEINTLPWEKIRRLVRTSQLPTHRCCMPALGLMLWAGVRPAEVKRLRWDDIAWEDEVIMIRAKHSKTGGSRCVTLPPVLRRWLGKLCRGRHRTGPICPKNWAKRWLTLRHIAGVLPWQQDVLRHTFASYHLKHYKNLLQLQIEMGHSSPQLLRTRYLNMRGLTKANARRFWSPKEWCP